MIYSLTIHFTEGFQPREIYGVIKFSIVMDGQFLKVKTKEVTHMFALSSIFEIEIREQEAQVIEFTS